MRVIGMHAQCARWTSRRRFASGIMHSMDVAFDVRPGADVITVKATPAWITGMAYAVTGALSHRCTCLLYTSPSPRDGLLSRMPSSA